MTAPDGGVQRSWPWVQLSALVLVFGLFLWSMVGLLNPFLLFCLLVAVMHPFRDRDGYGWIVGAAAILTLLWLLDYTGFLLAPFVVAMILAYLLDPAVDRLSAGRLSRSLAILLLAVPIVGGLVVAGLFGLPALGQQIGGFIEGAPALLDRLAQWVQSAPDRVLGLNLPWLDEDALAERIRDVDGAAVIEFLRERQAAIATRVWEGVLGLGRGIGSFVAVVGYVVLTPVLTFYLLRDYDEIRLSIADLLPESRRAGIVEFAAEYDRLLARYLRGQFTVALIVGSLTAGGLALLDFPYALMLGVTVAVLGIVPYLGLVFSLIPAVVIALLEPEVGLSLLKVAIVYGGAQALEGTVISPKIVGESVGLHPVWVVLALAVGGYVFGFVGLLIGVPLAVATKLLVERGLERYRNSGVYGKAAPEG